MPIRIVNKIPDAINTSFISLIIFINTPKNNLEIITLDKIFWQPQTSKI